MTALVLVALIGLVVGSFLNVVVYRVPRGESLVSPGSHCPSCGTPIRPWHNVPVVSWLVLRGRCAACGAPISPRYPLVEAGTAVLFVVLTVRLDALWQRAAVPAFLTFFGLGLALALIDLDTRRLPTPLILPAYPVLAVLLTGAAWWQGDWWALARAVLGGVALLAFFFALVFVYPAGMGFGDVRLAGLIGGVLGYLSWATLAVGAFAAFLLGALVAIAVLATGRGGRRAAIPFGPFLVTGAFVGVFAGDPIGQWYGNLLML